MRKIKHFLLSATIFSLAGILSAGDLIVEVEMPPREKKHHLYSGVQDISIKGNSFYRDGNPYFVSGA